MSDEATLHLEYLYGPQWRDVVAIVERAGQLTAEERERMNSVAGRNAEEQLKNLQGVAMNAGGGLSALLSGLGQQTGSQSLQIATQSAKEFGRTRNVQVASTIAGQALSPGVGTGDFAGILQSLGVIGAVTVVSQAVSAAVLGDLVGRGAFTQSVHDELMRPWRESIQG